MRCQVYVHTVSSIDMLSVSETLKGWAVYVPISLHHRALGDGWTSLKAGFCTSYSNNKTQDSTLISRRHHHRAVFQNRLRLISAQADLGELSERAIERAYYCSEIALGQPEEHQQPWAHIVEGVPDKFLNRDIDLLLAHSGLASKANLLATNLSGGNQVKLSLAIALIGDNVILVDEFSSGVDNSSNREAWQTVSVRIGLN